MLCDLDPNFCHRPYGVGVQVNWVSASEEWLALAHQDFVLHRSQQSAKVWPAQYRTTSSS